MRIAVTVLTAATLLAPAPPGAFTLGALRRDGIVIPFATYDGKHWRSDWPAPQEHVDVPIDLRNVPSRWWGPMGPLDTWQVWPPAGEPRIVHVRQPDWFKAECQRQVGLRTDYAPAERPPRDDEAQPYPKDGLAVSPPRPIERIENVTPRGSVPSLPPPEVVRMFDAEQERVSREFAFRWFRLETGSEAQRALVPLAIEAVYAFGDPAVRRTYYFEVSKEYAPKGREDCPIVTFGRGWFVSEPPGPLRRLQFNVQFSDCERSDIHYMLPLGVIRLGGKVIWVSQSSGWDFERFSVTELAADRPRALMSASGGGCPE